MASTRDSAIEALQRRFAGDSVSHLWSDALFARLRARQAEEEVQRAPTGAGGLRAAIEVARKNQAMWERGSFVRWTVTTGWTAMEQLFKHELNERQLHGIPGVLVTKMKSKGLPMIDAASAPWPAIDVLRDQRNDFTHNSLTYAQRMAPLKLAEDSIARYREAVVDFYATLGRPEPVWIHLDDVPDRVPGSMGVLGVNHADLESAGPPVKLVTVFGGHEFSQRTIRGDEDPYPYARELINNSIVPLSEVRIYRGDTLEDTLVLQGRGT